MFEFFPGSVFFLSAFLILVNIAIYTSIGYHFGWKAKEKEIITLIVRQLDLQDPEHLIKAVEAATEKKQLLESERDRLIETILKEAEKQKND